MIKSGKIRLNDKMGGSGGFTIVEVLVAVAVVAMVMTAVVSGVSFSVKNTRFARDQALAVRYTQEALEWIRQVRDESGWRTFTNELGNDGNPVSYCLMSIPATFAEFVALVNGLCQAGEVIGGTIYTRQMSLDLTGSEATAEVSVTWDEGGQTKEVLQRSTLYDWQK